MSQDHELCFLTASEAIAGFKAGEFSPVELLQATIARCEQINPKISAFTYTFFERALEQSRDPTEGNTHIIWAHMGDAPAAAIDGLLDRHANLYVDISSRNPLCSFTDRIASLEEQRLDDGS